jgi:hypothetical protein
MKIISHRANLYGKDLKTENNPSQIDKVIEMGFDVEIDLRIVNGTIYLGHDYPQYPIDFKWLEKRKENLWIHTKDHFSVNIMKTTDFNWFWHNMDDMTLTSHGYIWSNIGIFIQNGITVSLEFSELPDYILGVCTDEPIKFKK